MVLYPVSGRDHGLHGLEEVGLSDEYLLEVEGKFLAGLVHLGVAPSKGVEHGLGAEAFQVGPAVPDGLVREQLHHGGLHWGVPLAQALGQNLFPGRLCGKGEPELTVESAGSPQGRVDVLDSVCRARYRSLPQSSGVFLIFTLNWNQFFDSESYIAEDIKSEANG